MHDTAPHAAAGPALHQIRRRYVALGLVLVALVLLGALILIRHDKAQPNSGTSETFTDAPGSVISATTQIPLSLTNAIGVDSPGNEVVAPSAVKGAPLWRQAAASGAARPVVFFYGAEFTPYAAAERWPLVVALSRFGTFTQLGQQESSSTEVFPDIWSFTFWHVTYQSRWLSLATIERYGAVNPTGARYVSLQRPTAAEAIAVSAYDTTATTFPLLDVGNRFVLVGSSFSPATLTGLSQADIVSDLASPASPVTQAIVAAANEITAAICDVTGQKPGAVCNAHGVVAADDKMGIGPAR